MDPMIKTIRLTTGEDIIGLVTKETKTTITVANPLVVHTEEDMGRSAMILVKLCPYSKSQAYTFSRNHVLFSEPVIPEMEKHYVLSLRINLRSDREFLSAIQSSNQELENFLFPLPVNLFPDPASKTRH